MTDLGLCRDLRPVPAALLQRFPDLGVEFDVHAGIIAKFCDTRKQPIATVTAHSGRMPTKPINQVVAEALNYFIDGRWSDVELGRRAGVAANTIANVRQPGRRMAGASGKEPSVKLTELALIAESVGVRVADLTEDLSQEDRLRIYRRRAGEFYQENGRLPDWAPGDNFGKPKAAAA